MRDEPGATTSDLITLRHRLRGEAEPTTTVNPDLFARETINRWYGAAARIGGAVIVVATLVGSLAFNSQLDAALPPRVHALLITTFQLLGFGFMLIGCMELLTRYNRTLARLQADKVNGLGQQLQLLTTQVSQLVGATDAQAAQIAAMHDIVKGLPGYPEGVMDGATMFKEGMIPSTRMRDDDRTV